MIAALCTLFASLALPCLAQLAQLAQLAPESPRAAQGPLVIATYELGLAAPRAESEECALLLFPSYAGDRARAADVETHHDFVTDVLRSVLADEFEYEGRSLELLEGGLLRVIAPAPVQERVRRMLGHLEQVFGSCVRIRIDILSGSETPFPAGVLAPAEAERLRREHARASTVLCPGPGRAAVADLSSEAGLVHDFDLEVAQHVFMHDPVLHTLCIGPRLALRASPAGDGARILLTLHSNGWAGPLQVQELATVARLTAGDNPRALTEDLKLESRPLANRSLALASFARPGEVLALSTGWDVEGGSGREGVLVEVLGPLPPARWTYADGQRELALWNGEALVPPHWREGTVLPEGGWRIGNGEVVRGLFYDPYEGPRVHVFSAAGDSEEISWMEGWLTALNLEEPRFLGPWLADVRASGTGAAAELPAARVERATVELALVQQSETGRRVLAQTAFTALCGEDAACAVGVEQATVVDFDVEVAQGSGASDPVLGLVFEGLLARVRPERTLAGGWFVEVGAVASVLAEPLRSASAGGPQSELQVAERRELRVGERIVFAPGEETFAVLGDSSGSSSSSPQAASTPPAPSTTAPATVPRRKSRRVWVIERPLLVAPAGTLQTVAAH